MRQSIHATAERLAAQKQVTKSEALSMLAKRRKNYGRTTVRPNDLPSRNVETPKRYWWND